MDNKGPFDPATYGGDAEKALLVRQAFLHGVPRQEIVDKLIKPINPDAEVRNSFVKTAGTPGYDEIVAQNGSADYAEVDPALSKTAAQAGRRQDAGRRAGACTPRTTSAAQNEFAALQAGARQGRVQPDRQRAARTGATSSATAPTTPSSSAGSRPRPR